jgi:hypothetical protein
VEGSSISSVTPLAAFGHQLTRRGAQGPDELKHAGRIHYRTEKPSNGAK